MHQADEAVARFAQGFSCSQAVFSVFAEESGLDRDTALRIASGFGGGMGGMGHTCGAVTGAYMAIGLKHGPVSADREAKAAVYARVRSFAEQFCARHGSVACRDLLGCDIGTPEGLARARESGVFREVCPRLVRTACELLELD
jgi:C_GCAxxG_C_C family probable redox protein